jgi:uncharacterized protein YegP (UPF0339 family)
MATAAKKTRAARQVARRAIAVSESAGITFLVYEDNAGDYRWMILGSRGDESLAQSGTFATYEDAAHAARVVRDGAGSARFEPRAASDRPVDLVARRKAAVAGDDSDAERWLDEGGSFSSEAVTQWPAGR